MLALLPLFLWGQQRITGVSVRWSDSFDEWTIYTEYEGEEGTLTRRSTASAEGQIWDYRLGEQTGSIRIKWASNPLEWEVRGDNLIGTARAPWRDTYTEWRVNLTQGGSVTWRSRYPNLPGDWILDDVENSGFNLYTFYQGDPRDWVVSDEWPQAALADKMLLLTLTVVYGIQAGR